MTSGKNHLGGEEMGGQRVQRRRRRLFDFRADIHTSRLVAGLMLAWLIVAARHFDCQIAFVRSVRRMLVTGVIVPIGTGRSPCQLAMRMMPAAAQDTMGGKHGRQQQWDERAHKSSVDQANLNHRYYRRNRQAK